MSDQLAWWQYPIVIQSHSYQVDLPHDPAGLEALVRWKREAGFDAEHLILNFSMFTGKGGDD